MAKVLNLTSSVIEEGLHLLYIEISSNPTKLDYSAGESFDPSGMVVIANYENGFSSIVTGYDWSPRVLSTQDSYVTITYAAEGESSSTLIPITVTELIATVPSTTSSFTYNGSSHSPTWTNYDPELMTISGTTNAINAGNYTVTFTLKDNVKWADGTSDPKSVSWSISKATPTLYPSTYSLSFDDGDSAKTITIYSSGGSMSVSSSNSGVATASLSGSTLTVTPGSTIGDAKINITLYATTNYNGATTSISVKRIGFAKTHDYTSAGTYTFTAVGSTGYAILIGGGGGGGAGGFSLINDTVGYSGMGGGGGGRASIIKTSEISLSKGSSYTVVVGSGGAGGTWYDWHNSDAAGNRGGASSAFGSTADGGPGGHRGEYGSHSVGTTSDGGGYGGSGSVYSGSSVYIKQGASGCDGVANSDSGYTTAGGGGGGGGTFNASARTSGGSGSNGGGSGGAGGVQPSSGAASTKGNNGSNATGYGNGGGGGGGGATTMLSTVSGGNGGNGSSGRVIIFEKGT